MSMGVISQFFLMTVQFVVYKATVSFLAGGDSGYFSRVFKCELTVDSQEVIT